MSEPETTETTKAPAPEVPATKAKKAVKKTAPAKKASKPAPAPVEVPAKKAAAPSAKKAGKVIEEAKQTIHILTTDRVFRGQRLAAWNLLKDKMPLLVFLDRCTKAGLDGNGILGKWRNVFKVVEVR